jgi:hypothetical protein
MDGRALASAVLETYIDKDPFFITAYIADPLFLNFDSMTFDIPSFISQESTMTAIDLSVMPALVSALNELSVVLQSSDPDQIAHARTYAQPYSSIFGDQVPPSFIDLGSLMKFLQHFNPEDEALNKATGDVLAAIEQATIAERHGELRSGSTGFSVYFPVDYLFSFTSDPETQRGVNYTRDASRFAAASLWDDFLLYFYSGTPIDPSSADVALLEPAQSAGVLALEFDTDMSAEVLAPPLYSVEITAFDLVSADVLTSDETVDLHAEVHGDGIAYIYLYFYLYYEEDDSYLVMDSLFVQSGSQEVGGVVYPEWGQDGVTVMDLQWVPTVYNMSDSSGEQVEFANFAPYSYAYTAEEMEYIVYGTYTFADSGNETYAAMIFQNGVMQVIYSYTGGSGFGSFPAEITPHVGDTFTIWQDWVEYTDNPEGEYVSRLGETLTYNGEPFLLVSGPAPAGLYQIGLLVEDLGGNTQWATVSVTITE